MQAVSAYIGLGSNLGDSIATISRAVRTLDTLPQTRLKACSSLFLSAPFEATGNDFINAVAELETSLNPETLLTHLQSIELDFERTRSYKNAPRTLDLDLLLHGHETINSVQLVVPHPRMTERAFVLYPLLEIAPEILIPGLGAASNFLPLLTKQRITQLTPRHEFL